MTDHEAPSLPDLIDRLSHDLQPVRVRSLRSLAIQYFVTLLALGLLCFGLIGAIFGVWVGVTQTEFVLSGLIFTLSIAAGSFLLAQYSRPGVTVSRPAKIAFFALIGLAGLMEIIRYLMQVGLPTWGPPIQGGWVCLLCALTMGGIGVSILMIQLLREAPVKLTSAALFVLLTAGLMGAMVLQIHCPNENPVHQILWHIGLPLGLFALSAKSLARLALRW